MDEEERAMLRVLQVVTKMDRGGLETMLMNYYRNIDRSLVQFDFLLHREEKGAYDDEILSLGGRIYHVPRLNPLNPEYYKALNRFFRDHRYAIVHSHLDCTNSFPLRAAKKAGVSIRIVHVHSTKLDFDYKFPVRAVSKLLTPLYATDFFACGETAGRWAFPNREFTVMRNAIDVGKYLPNQTVRQKTRKEFGLSSEFLVGHVGRFDYAKNHGFLLKVFSELKRVEPNAKLMLVGDGEKRGEIKGEVSRLGLEQDVIFTGVRSDVNDLMQAMDVFVMPSLYEGFPVVMVEAQASGLPCVMSDKVPGESALVGGLVASVPLAEKVDVWVDAILKAKEKARTSHFEELSSKGFDIKTAASWLADYYLSKL